MNRTFKTIWNRVRNLWVCVAETVSNHAQGLNARLTRRTPRLSTRLRPSLRALALALLGTFAGVNVAQADYVQWLTPVHYLAHDPLRPAPQTGYAVFGPSISDLPAQSTLILPWHSHLSNQYGATVYCKNQSLCFAQSPHWSVTGSQAKDVALLAVATTNPMQSIVLNDAIIEGDILLGTRNTLTLDAIANQDLGLLGEPMVSLTPSTHHSTLIGNIRFSELSNLTLANTLGTLYRQASDSLPETMVPRVRFASEDGSGTITLRKPAEATDLLFDLDALNHYAATGDNEAIEGLTIETSVHVVNTLDRPRFEENDRNAHFSMTLESTSETGLLTLDVQSPTNLQRAPQLYGAGVVKFDGGETLAGGISYDAMDYERARREMNSLTYFLDRNVVMLGDITTLYLPTVASQDDPLLEEGTVEEAPSEEPEGPIEIPMISAEYSVTMADPSMLWGNNRPYWTNVIDLSRTYVATINDITSPLTQTQLSQMGGLMVRHGTVTLDGTEAPITTPITIRDEGVLDIVAGSTITVMNATVGGEIRLHRGTTTIEYPDFGYNTHLTFDAGAQLRLGSDNDLTGLSIASVTTRSTTLDELTEQFAYHPRHFITLGEISALPESMTQFTPDAGPGNLPTTWVVGAKSSVTNYPAMITVRPEVTLNLSGASTRSALKSP